MLQRRANPFEGQKNVFGEPLKGCSDRPVTGFYRTGCCHTGPEDFGLHTVCVEVTAEATLEIVDLEDLKRYAIDLA
jgi:uncharacterized protein (DUF2237 family)